MVRSPPLRGSDTRRCTCAKRSSQAWLSQPWPHWSSRSPRAAARPHRPPPRRFPAARRTSSACSTTPDTLTIGADNPAYPPWFGGDEKTKPWKVSDPYSGKGYESAVAYAVAKQLGFTKAQVKWTVVPFNNSFRPGKKSFDVYLTQVSYNPERAKAVDFSKSYYFVNQSLVGAKGTPIASAKSITALKKLQARRPGRDDELRLHRRT